MGRADLPVVGASRPPYWFHVRVGFVDGLEESGRALRDVHLMR
jgi:hypothetical protein